MDELPGIIIALVIIYFVARWFRGSGKTDDAAGGDTPSSGPLRGVSTEMITTVTSAFPHVSPSSVVYSLSKTKSAQATVEQILSPRALPEPPASFPVHPYLQRLATASAATTTANQSASSNASNPGSSSSSSTTTTRPISKPSQTLIDRYGLGSKIASQDKGKGRAVEPLSRVGAVHEPVSANEEEVHSQGRATNEKQGPLKWEATAEERQNALNERKRSMVLEARRRMLEKKAAKQTTA